jgi:tellurite resistance protein TehA-like permease
MKRAPASVAEAFARLAHGADLGSFAMVMATGIVSGGLRQAGRPVLSTVLLGISVAGFALLAAAACLRAARSPASLRADLACPVRAFTGYALVAACAVLASGFAVTGQRTAAAALAGAALAGWLMLTGLVPARLAVRAARERLAITQVNGTWYLWTVATQSLAVAVGYLAADGVLPAGPAAVAAIVAWSVGIALYLATSALVVTRLTMARPGPQESRAPYWVAMGAAAISVFAAARILRLAGSAAVAAGRPLITGVAIADWVVATCLVPVLTAMTLARLRSRGWPRYWPGMWVVVFPIGMYAMAGMQLGAAAGLPLIWHAGEAAVWPALAAWAVTFAELAAAAPFAGRPRLCWRHGRVVPFRRPRPVATGRQVLGPGGTSHAGGVAVPADRAGDRRRGPAAGARRPVPGNGRPAGAGRVAGRGQRSGTGAVVR